jgi:hypothetical protein
MDLPQEFALMDEGLSFFKRRGLKNIPIFLVYWNWRIPETHGACVERVQKTN